MSARILFKALILFGMEWQMCMNGLMDEGKEVFSLDFSKVLKNIRAYGFIGNIVLDLIVL